MCSFWDVFCRQPGWLLQRWSDPNGGVASLRIKGSSADRPSYLITSPRLMVSLHAVAFCFARRRRCSLFLVAQVLYPAACCIPGWRINFFPRHINRRTRRPPPLLSKALIMADTDHRFTHHHQCLLHRQFQRPNHQQATGIQPSQPRRIHTQPCRATQLPTPTLRLRRSARHIFLH